jgi:AcrR family transcriptional regulator
MGRPRESDREDLRTLILGKAKELFLKEGYAHITIRKIARAIGYTPATIYLYFQNKDEILYELHNEGFRLLYESKMRMLSTVTGGALDRLAKGGRMYIEFALENPEYYELMFNMPEPRDFLAEMRKKAQAGGRFEGDFAMLCYQFLRQGVELAQAEGFLQGQDADTLAFSLWAFVHGLVTLIIRKRIPYPQTPGKELAFAVVDSLSDLLNAAPPAGKPEKDQ